VCIYVCILIYVYLSIYLYINAYVCVCTYICIYMYISGTSQTGGRLHARVPSYTRSVPYVGVYVYPIYVLCVACACALIYCPIFCAFVCTSHVCPLYSVRVCPYIPGLSHIWMCKYMYIPYVYMVQVCPIFCGCVCISHLCPMYSMRVQPHISGLSHMWVCMTTE
jgi:hypothetical protein